MGYISEVAIAIRRTAYQELIEGIPENTEAIKSLIDSAEVTKKNDGILLYWDAIKWYSADTEKFMESLYAIDSDNFYKVEVGESLEDNQTDGAYWDNPFNICITRSIYKEV
jgi:hypothetical protein